MSIKVHNFCTKDKLSTNRYHNILMQAAVFYITVSDDSGNFRELALNVVKKFHYERHVSYGNFDTAKANEYNVLVDFIINNKKNVIEKWHLEEGEYEDLLEGLKMCLIRYYATCSGFERLLLEAAEVFKSFVRKICRRIKEWSLK